MNQRLFAAALGVTAVATAPALGQGWVTFVNETSTRLVAAPGLGSADPEEKDFAYADLDNDGDIDLVLVRKQPFTNPNGKRNVLFMNENGVLVDRTNEFATAADDGGQGFLDITNDRDVAIADFDGDGWLDVVTCPALNQSLPKTISHPRIYRNLGGSAGSWLGLRYEQARIPQMPAAPNGCGIAVGDVTGNGFPDIYIVDYLSNQEDRLLINNGSGFFSDETSQRLTPTMISSGFGTAGAIVDLNGDGINDICKSENGPFKTTYNNPASVGTFNKHETSSGGAHYGMSAGDLNNDGKVDIVLGDDGLDRYLLNLGPNAAGMATWQSKTFSFVSGGDDGFANNSRIVDLNNDGWNDVLIADVDVDIGGCSRRLHLYRNLGNGPSVTLQDQGTGGMPANQLTGTHDLATFDLNGDGWVDLVLGRCAGTSVWMNQPPVGLVVGYPDGLPALVVPDVATPFTVSLSVIGAGALVPGTEKLNWRQGGGPVTTVDLLPEGSGLYAASLPALACTESLEWWVTANLTPGGTFSDPPQAPNTTYLALSTIGTEVLLRDEMEGDVSGWSVENDPSLTGGAWEVASPNGTIFSGQLASPNADATSGDGVQAWVTQNGPAGAAANTYDVDGGPTRLISPSFDIAGEDAFISFAGWFFCEDAGVTGADFLYVDISADNGATWENALQIATTNSTWKNFSFRAGDFVAPSSTMRVRFWTVDSPNNSITEAGIDNFQIERIGCDTTVPCPADLDGDGVVDGSDLGLLLATWGGKGASDLDGNGTVDGADLGLLLGAFGACK